MSHSKPPETTDLVRCSNLGALEGKRNTSRPVFTAHERAVAKLAWASSSARLSRDSFLPFGSCCLCLESARDPVCCSRGDIFCRECVLSNLVAQRKGIKRLHIARDQTAQDQQQAQARQDEDTRERTIKDFETLQAGLASHDGRPTHAGAEQSANAVSPRQGAKRKFVLDDQELAQVSQVDRNRAREALEAEKVRSCPATHSLRQPAEALGRQLP
jgi:nitric oxide synthase-interacting protein